ncbi:MAG: CopD family protein [Pseudomonadota bacterium]
MLRRLDRLAALQLRQQALVGAVAVALLSALRVVSRMWFLTGGSLGEAMQPAIAALVLESPLGAAVQMRAVGCAALLFLMVGTRFNRWIGAAGAVLICASFGLRGHVAQGDGGLLPVLVTLHLLTAAFWVGGFRPLYSLACADPRAAGEAAHEFGRLALWAVAVLVAAGGALLFTLTGGLAALGTLYGQVFALKLGAFAILLGLAAMNKLRLTPAMRTGSSAAARQLRQSIRMEMRLVLVILAVTAIVTETTAAVAAG